MSEGARAETIRVLHLRDTTRICGPAKTILETLRLHRDSDIEYVVCAFGRAESNEFLRAAADLGPVWALPAGRGAIPTTALSLARRIREERIRLVHAHDFKTDAVGLAASRLAGVPALTTLHGYIAVHRKSRIYRALDRWLLARMDRVIAVSEAMAADLAALGIRRERVRVVRNGIRPDRYPFGFRSARLDGLLPPVPGRAVLGHIGRLSPEKGQMLAIRAMPRVLAKVPEAALVLAGSGPDEPRLRGLVNELRLDRRVHFLGHQSDVVEVFGALDVLVLSSDTEGLPNVVLEAMALGVPVVATAVGGTPELIRDGEHGWLVPPSSEERLASSILEALASRSEAGRRARAARERVEREFSMERLVHRTHEIYRELIREASR